MSEDRDDNERPSSMKIASMSVMERAKLFNKRPSVTTAPIKSTKDLAAIRAQLEAAKARAMAEQSGMSATDRIKSTKDLAELQAKIDAMIGSVPHYGLKNFIRKKKTM